MTLIHLSWSIRLSPLWCFVIWPPRHRLTCPVSGSCSLMLLIPKSISSMGVLRTLQSNVDIHSQCPPVPLWAIQSSTRQWPVLAWRCHRCLQGNRAAWLMETFGVCGWGRAGPAGLGHAIGASAVPWQRHNGFQQACLAPVTLLLSSQWARQPILHAW